VPDMSWTIDSKTDVMLAGDLGYNFSFKPTVVKRSARARNQQVQDGIVLEDEDADKTPRQDMTQQHTPAGIAGFQFEIHYGGEEQRGGANRVGRRREGR